MESNPDTYRAAYILIEEHGDEAVFHAIMRADAMLFKGDLEGRAAWLRVVKAVNELLDEQPGEHDVLH